jgi:protein-tyrosine phosphatase
MNLIMDRLWLGDMVGAYNKFLLKKNGVTHILTVAQGIHPKFPTLFNYKIVNILDSPTANLKQHFPSCIKFIRDAIEEGGCVLVHCFAGVSRSATIVIAYLMQEYGMSNREAFQFVRQKRYFIHPNDGFKRQLQQFHRELQG